MIDALFISGYLLSIKMHILFYSSEVEPKMKKNTMMETIVMLIPVNTRHINLANKILSKSTNRIYYWEYRNIQGYSTVFLSQKYNQPGNFLPMESSSGMPLFYHASAVILSIIHSMAVMEMHGRNAMRYFS